MSQLLSKGMNGNGTMNQNGKGESVTFG